MSENENVELELNEGDIEEGEVEGEKQEKPEPKAKLTPEQQRGILQRKLSKLDKELGITSEEKPATKKEEKKGFDYAEKAYLKTSGIQSDEFEFVKEVMDSTGKSLDEVLETKYFQAELKERREAKAVKDAIPNGSKRSGASASNEVQYWLNKGELPPADQKELRQKVVNARIKSEGQKDVFTTRSVVGG